MNNKNIGDLGEKVASDFLKKQGYKIIERNYECKQGEIDIIAIDKKELVFIEVKTRNSKKYGEAIEAITPEKLKHLISSIKYYLYERNLQDEFIRIDAIEVYLEKNIIINHIKKIV